MVRQFVICVVLALLRPPAISCCYRCYHLLRSKLEQSVLDCWCWDLATQRQTVATEVYWSTEIRHNSVEIFSVLILELEFKSVRTPDRPDLIPTEERQNSKCQLSSVKYYCRNNHDKTREMAARQIFDRKLCQKFGKKISSNDIRSKDQGIIVSKKLVNWKCVKKKSPKKWRGDAIFF